MAFLLFPLKNFPNETFAVIFSILFIIILIIEPKILLRYKSKKEDKSSLMFIILGIFMPVVTNIFLSYTNIGEINTTVSYLGLIIIISGFVLRQYSIKILGRFFTPVIMLQKDQKLIQEGPYKYIRHPSYTGLLLELTGLSLSLSNWLSLLITLILFLPVINYRIKIEEEFLNKNFKGYPNYQKRTKKLIPYIY